MGFYRYLVATWSVITTLTVVNASENIALGKTTNQNSVLRNWDSSKAVDGCVRVYMISGCCSHTVTGKTEAWWQVDLQTQSVIETVKIIYRDERTLNRLAGYEIYLSNTSDWTSGTRCHKDTTANLASMSAEPHVICQGVAEYLTIYNDRRVKAKTWYSDTAVLELCEVQVYGCPVGKYGNGNCNNDCTNCVNNVCDSTSGTCGSCDTGYYKSGQICSICPISCAENICDSISGVCTEDVYSSGTPGLSLLDFFLINQCSFATPIGLSSLIKSRKLLRYQPYSNVPDGCKTRFSGIWCRCPGNCKEASCPGGLCTDCNDGYYGSACTSCPSGCSTDTCDKTSGYCDHCNDGFYGPICTPCPSGCSTDICDKTSGHCVQCSIGLHGSFCNQSCPVNCKNNVCNTDNGQCQECNDGFYGPNCTKSCFINCKNNVCMMDGGQCTECVPGFYGSECNESCPDNCQDASCKRSSAVCEACIAGFHGSQCSKTCGNCHGVSCDKDTGDCATGCTDGWTGDKCDIKVVMVMDKNASVGIGVGLGAVIMVLIAVIIVQTRRLRMKRDDNATSTHTTDISLTRTATEVNNDQDGNYDEITTHNEQRCAHISHTEGSYEKLGRREVEIPHIYDTTNIDMNLRR